MTNEEVQPYVGKAVRIELADGRMLAGTLQAQGEHGHGHVHYAVMSDALRKGEPPVREVLHGAESIVEIEDASNDPAATLS